MNRADTGSRTPGLLTRLAITGVVLAIPLVAVGIGLAVALSSATEGVRGGLVAAMVTWGVACAAAVGAVLAFTFTVVGPVRRLARGASQLAAGGAAEGLPADRGDEFGVTARALLALAADREQLRDQLRDSALRDPDTGLYDARELRQRLDHEQARARRYDHPFSLVVVDVDTSDRELTGVAAALRAAVRPTDVVARLGETSFAALLPETEEEGAVRVVDRLRSGLGGGLAGVGVASHPTAGATADQVLRAAIGALDGSRSQRGEPVVYGR